MSQELTTLHQIILNYVFATGINFPESESSQLRLLLRALCGFMSGGVSIPTWTCSYKTHLQIFNLTARMPMHYKLLSVTLTIPGQSCALTCVQGPL